MGEALEVCWFEALCDNPEEAKALHALHVNKVEWFNKQVNQPPEIE